MAQVLGIGGVFFKSSDPAALCSWYRKWLGVQAAPPFGATFPPDAVPAGGLSVWAPFPLYRYPRAAPPGHEELVKIARQRNPHKRLTVPEDVARCITALCHPATYWMTGNTLHVDGGENVVG